MGLILSLIFVALVAINIPIAFAMGLASIFALGNGGRARSESFEGGDMNLIFHSPDFDSFQVLRSLDGTQVVGDLTKPVFPKRETLGAPSG